MTTGVIFVDADAMPRDALQSILRLGKGYGMRVVTVSSVAHNVESDEHISVDSSPQATDMKIISSIEKSVPTLVVTQDYGLAALALGKGAFAVSQNGLEYTNENIDRLLLERAIHAHERRAGVRTKGPSSRRAEQKISFVETLTRVLERMQ